MRCVRECHTISTVLLCTCIPIILMTEIFPRLKVGTCKWASGVEGRLRANREWFMQGKIKAILRWLAVCLFPYHIISPDFHFRVAIHVLVVVVVMVVMCWQVPALLLLTVPSLLDQAKARPNSAWPPVPHLTMPCPPPLLPYLPTLTPEHRTLSTHRLCAPTATLPYLPNPPWQP